MSNQAATIVKLYPEGRNNSNKSNNSNKNKKSNNSKQHNSYQQQQWKMILLTNSDTQEI